MTVGAGSGTIGIAEAAQGEGPALGRATNRFPATAPESATPPTEPNRPRGAAFGTAKAAAEVADTTAPATFPVPPAAPWPCGIAGARWVGLVAPESGMAPWRFGVAGAGRVGFTAPRLFDGNEAAWVELTAPGGAMAPSPSDTGGAGCLDFVTPGGPSGIDEAACPGFVAPGGPSGTEKAGRAAFAAPSGGTVPWPFGVAGVGGVGVAGVGGVGFVASGVGMGPWSSAPLLIGCAAVASGSVVGSALVGGWGVVIAAEGIRWVGSVGCAFCIGHLPIAAGWLRAGPWGTRATKGVGRRMGGVAA
ncbi:hypothetical protein Actkin_03371 [Actinokineospora sp. UTMC 2448]|nr:hypothetical protein Actkin_03371 [Actinokineospora sp. UTMC 2448]